MVNRFTRNISWNLFWQSVLAMVFCGTVLFFLSLFKTAALTWAVGGGAIASSSYLVFALPSSPSSQPRNIMGGFAIAMICGVLVQQAIITADHWCHLWHCRVFHFPVFLSAIVVGIVLVLMALFNCPHPPAAGLSLVLVLDLQDTQVLVVITVAVLLLILLKSVLRKHLKDLF